jgi:ATP-dependent Clp protease ATP-binding subunit ClpA
MANVHLDTLRTETEARTVFKEKVPTSVEIPFSEEAKRVLKYTAEEADRLRHSYIGTEHILLGLLREESTNAGAILASHGLHLAEVREELSRLLNENPDHSKTRPPTATEVAAVIERIKEQVNALAQLAVQRSNDAPEVDAMMLVQDIHAALDRLKSPGT